MSTYSGYINRTAFEKHVVDFLKKLNESVARMRGGKEEYEQRRGG